MPAEVVVMAQASAVSLLNAVSQGAGTVNGTGLDLSGYEGVCQVVQNLGTITGSVSANKLQDSADNSSWADITGATFGTTASALTVVNIDTRSVRRYVRYTATVTTGPAAVSVTLTGMKKSRP